MPIDFASYKFIFSSIFEVFHCLDWITNTSLTHHWYLSYMAAETLATYHLAIVSATTWKKIGRVLLVSYRSSIGGCRIEGSTTMSVDTPYKTQIQKLYVCVIFHFFLVPEKSKIFQWDAEPQLRLVDHEACIAFRIVHVRQPKMILIIKFWFSYIVLFHQNSKLISTQFLLANICVDKSVSFFSLFLPIISSTTVLSCPHLIDQYFHWNIDDKTSPFLMCENQRALGASSFVWWM